MEQASTNRERMTNVVTRWYSEVWNSKNEATIDELFAADAYAHGLTDEKGNTIRGPWGFKAYFRNMIKSYPDIQVTVHQIILDGEDVATRCTATFTNPADGKPL